MKKDPKRIVLTSNTAFSMYNYRLGLMQELINKGNNVYVLAPKDQYTPFLEKEFSFVNIKNLDRKGINPLKDLKLIWEYYALYKEIKPDLVINFTIKPNIYSSIVCGVLSIPTISVVTGLGYVFINKSWVTEIVKILYRFSFLFNKFVIVLNEEDLGMLSKITTLNKLKLFRGEGVNTEFFSPHYCKKDEGNDNFVFLFHGRFLKDKGIYELIEAGRMLNKERQDFEIWLVGAIDKGNPASLNENDVERIRKEPFVRIFDFSMDIRDFICNSDIVVLPSYYKEGVPRSLLEAMAMEKPIITTKSAGCKDVCSHGVNGFLVEKKNIYEFFKVMRDAVGMPKDEIALMGKKGREMVIDRFDEKIIIRKYMQLIEEIF